MQDIGGVASFELPLGFLYLDDGKTRFTNDPLLSYAAPRTLIGAVVALDDAWQHERDNPPHSTGGHIGQMTMVHELLGSGDYAPLFLPAPRNGSKALHIDI